MPPQSEDTPRAARTFQLMLVLAVVVLAAGMVGWVMKLAISPASPADEGAPYQSGKPVFRTGTFGPASPQTNLAGTVEETALEKTAVKPRTNQTPGPATANESSAKTAGAVSAAPTAAPTAFTTFPMGEGDASGAASIRGHVVLSGNPPPEKPLPFDPSCGRLHPQDTPTTRFFVVSSDGGLADVLVYVEPTEVSPALPRRQRPSPVLLDQVGCEYTPYILAIQTDQTLLVRNSDPVMHNVHPTPAVAGNPESNRAQIPKSPDLAFTFAVPEAFLRFKCDVHPWMFAYVTVMEHSAFAVTDARGNFQLHGLQPGSYLVKAVHRKTLSSSQQTIVTKGRVSEANFVLKAPE